jgi:hypothetical protein
MLKQYISFQKENTQSDKTIRIFFSWSFNLLIILTYIILFNMLKNNINVLSKNNNNINVTIKSLKFDYFLYEN